MGGPSPLLQHFLVFNLFYRLHRVSKGYFKEKHNFPRFQRVPTFSRGIQLFLMGGVQMLISIETHITCFARKGGGVQTPYPHLDPRMSLMHFL